MIVICIHPKEVQIEDLKLVLSPGEIYEMSDEQALSSKHLYVAISQKRLQALQGSVFSKQLAVARTALTVALSEVNDLKNENVLLKAENLELSARCAALSTTIKEPETNVGPAVSIITIDSTADAATLDSNPEPLPDTTGEDSVDAPKKTQVRKKNK